MGRVTLPQMKHWATELDADEQVELLEHLTATVGQGGPSKRVPLDLYGAFRANVPDDFDIDAVLREMRTEWEKEWTDDGEFVG